MSFRFIMLKDDEDLISKVEMTIESVVPNQKG